MSSEHGNASNAAAGGTVYFDLSDFSTDKRVRATREIVAPLRAALDAAAAAPVPASEDRDRLPQEVRAVLVRLVAGLASSDAAARQGFATALAALLRECPEVPTARVLRAFSEMLASGSGAAASASGYKHVGAGSGSSRRDVHESQLARIFLVLVLARGGRLATLAPDHVVSLMSELLVLAKSKKLVREVCFCAVAEIVRAAPNELLLEHVMPALTPLLRRPLGEYDMDTLALALSTRMSCIERGIALPFGELKQLLTAESMHELIPAFADAHLVHPRVHSAWPVVIKVLCTGAGDAPAAASTATAAASGKKSKSGKAAAAAPSASTCARRTPGAELAAFWQVVVERVYLQSTPLRMFLALRLLQMALPLVTAEGVRVLLSAPVVHRLTLSIGKLDNVLQAAAQATVRTLHAQVQAPDAGETPAAASARARVVAHMMLGAHSIPAFDKRAGVPVITSALALLDGDGARQLLADFAREFATPNAASADAEDADAPVLSKAISKEAAARVAAFFDGVASDDSASEHKRGKGGKGGADAKAASDANAMDLDLDDDAKSPEALAEKALNRSRAAAVDAMLLVCRHPAISQRLDTAARRACEQYVLNTLFFYSFSVAPKREPDAKALAKSGLVLPPTPSPAISLASRTACRERLFSFLSDVYAWDSARVRRVRRRTATAAAAANAAVASTTADASSAEDATGDDTSTPAHSLAQLIEYWSALDTLGWRICPVEEILSIDLEDSTNDGSDAEDDSDADDDEDEEEDQLTEVLASLSSRWALLRAAITSGVVSDELASAYAATTATTATPKKSSKSSSSSKKAAPPTLDVARASSILSRVGALRSIALFLAMRRLEDPSAAMQMLDDVLTASHHVLAVSPFEGASAAGEDVVQLLFGVLLGLLNEASSLTREVCSDVVAAFADLVNAEHITALTARLAWQTATSEKPKRTSKDTEDDSEQEGDDDDDEEGSDDSESDASDDDSGDEESNESDADSDDQDELSDSESAAVAKALRAIGGEMPIKGKAASAAAAASAASESESESESDEEMDVDEGKTPEQVKAEFRQYNRALAQMVRLRQQQLGLRKRGKAAARDMKLRVLGLLEVYLRHVAKADTVIAAPVLSLVEPLLKIALSTKEDKKKKGSKVTAAAAAAAAAASTSNGAAPAVKGKANGKEDAEDGAKARPLANRARAIVEAHGVRAFTLALREATVEQLQHTADVAFDQLRRSSDKNGAFLSAQVVLSVLRSPVTAASPAAVEHVSALLLKQLETLGTSRVQITSRLVGDMLRLLPSSFAARAVEVLAAQLANARTDFGRNEVCDVLAMALRRAAAEEGCVNAALLGKFAEGVRAALVAVVGEKLTRVEPVKALVLLMLTGANVALKAPGVSKETVQGALGGEATEAAIKRLPAHMLERNVRAPIMQLSSALGLAQLVGASKKEEKNAAKRGEKRQAAEAAASGAAASDEAIAPKTKKQRTEKPAAAVAEVEAPKLSAEQIAAAAKEAEKAAALAKHANRKAQRKAVAVRSGSAAATPAPAPAAAPASSAKVDDKRSSSKGPSQRK